MINMRITKQCNTVKAGELELIGSTTRSFTATATQTTSSNTVL